ncbi:hypothetical protein O6H91_04G006000 [Diphasiastrum complanatum]|uniref:Uncharacterized protein n=2 Tax=Diphasiastrum complanatum TaxID=34168 RepID=A0ACC2DUM2_DIPCM|nr:hypothetical protein O6H91_04G006000 [Diphasiastrum complanatum]KAJ7557702.1 hypothetical protein O6H91_04G006000 [Diphasiastrum complanatum]
MVSFALGFKDSHPPQIQNNISLSLSLSLSLPCFSFIVLRRMKSRMCLRYTRERESDRSIDRETEKSSAEAKKRSVQQRHGRAGAIAIATESEPEIACIWWRRGA